MASRHAGDWLRVARGSAGPACTAGQSSGCLEECPAALLHLGTAEGVRAAPVVPADPAGAETLEHVGVAPAPDDAARRGRQHRIRLCVLLRLGFHGGSHFNPSVTSGMSSTGAPVLSLGTDSVGLWFRTRVMFGS